MSPPVELVSTGSELLNGGTLNRHAQVLGEALQGIGFRLLRDTTVPDDAAAMREAIISAASRVDVVVVSGGLGPTSDDLTRDVVAAIFDRRVVTDPAALANIHERYRIRNRAITPATERHALLVEGAVVLANSAGLAPGERITTGGKTLFLLPGPPVEFRAILEDHVLPWLRQTHPEVVPPLVRRLKLCGMGEADLVQILEGRGFPPAGVDVAYCVAHGRVEVRLTAVPAEAKSLARAVADVTEAAGPALYAEGDAELEDTLGRLLVERGETLAVAESCTGGRVGSQITSTPGSSRFFLGGVIAYANDAKVRDLGVDTSLIAAHGAVSPEVARAMADGVRDRFGATWGLAITGIAGPGGGTPDKPVGLVYLGVAGPTGTTTHEHRFLGDRAVIQDWSARTALDQLRRRLT